MSADAVLVVGAINVDLVVASPTLPGPGETVIGPRLDTFGGGKGANAAVAAARLGAEVHLVAAVGRDAMGDEALVQLANEGVNVDAVTRVDSPTGAAIIAVDAHGENQISVGTGANAALTLEYVEIMLDRLAPRAAIVLVSTEVPDAAIVAALDGAARHSITSILNPAPVTASTAELASRASIITPNQTELEALADTFAVSEPSPHAAVAAATQASVIATLGADGAVIADPNGSTEVLRAAAIDAIDTTGAGDTFNGVLAASLASGLTLSAAARRAVKGASLSVRQPGARTGMPTAAELDGGS